MIVNNNLAPVTQTITNLYWQDENNVARINRIVQYILEREAAKQNVQRTCSNGHIGKFVTDEKGSTYCFECAVASR